MSIGSCHSPVYWDINSSAWASCWPVITGRAERQRRDPKAGAAKKAIGIEGKRVAHGHLLAVMAGKMACSRS